MIRYLTRQEVEHFDEHGYVAPIRVMTPSDAGQYRARVEEYFQHVDDAGTLRTKAHLHCPALIELVRLPAILDPITDLLGPDVLCRSSSVFLKEPGTPAHVAWHQDAAYWELEPPDVATAWVALTDSTVENGALQVLPGSHRGPLFTHGPTTDPANMLSRGQAILDPIDHTRAIRLVLAPGEMSIHHVRIAHRSEPNHSKSRRMGFAIRYVAAHVRKTGTRRDSAILVRGTDRYGNFDPEPPPHTA